MKKNEIFKLPSLLLLLDINTQNMHKHPKIIVAIIAVNY